MLAKLCNENEVLMNFFQITSEGTYILSFGAWEIVMKALMQGK